MREGTLRFALAALTAALLGACSLITGFEGYSSQGDRDGGLDAGLDAGGRDDGGGTTCDPACGERGECVDGVCRCGGGDACAGGESCCDGACVDPSSDVDHCGGCGAACPSGARATRTCESGSCGFACEAGFDDCDAAALGCETDLGTAASCGSCTRACASGELCGRDAGGTYLCLDSCPGGQMECSGSCVDTSSSLSHCGGCGMACPSLANTTSTCTGGACVYVCTGSFADCDSDLGTPATSNGCELVPPNRFRDDDGDGYGVASMTMRFCPGASSPGYATMSGDCDDSSASVHPGATERCNGTDDDCDGRVDEDLVLLPPQPVGTYSTTGGAIFPGPYGITWVPSRAQGAVVWSSQRTTSTHEIRFSRFDENARALVSDVIVATIGAEPVDLGVAWDGGAWVPIWIEGGRLKYARLTDDGGLLNGPADMPGTGGGSGMAAAVAQGADELALVFAVTSPREIRSTTMRSGSPMSYVPLLAFSGPVSARPAATFVGGGSYAAVMQSPSDNSLVYQRFRSGGLDGPSTRLFSGGELEYPAQAAWDPDTNQVAATYYTIGATGRASLIMLDAMTGGLRHGPRDVGPGSTIPSVSVADDATLLVSTYSTDPMLRVRASDFAVLPAPPSFMSPASISTALRGTRHHFIGFFTTGGSGENRAQVLTCP